MLDPTFVTVSVRLVITLEIFAGNAQFELKDIENNVHACERFLTKMTEPIFCLNNSEEHRQCCIVMATCIHVVGRLLTLL